MRCAGSTGNFAGDPNDSAFRATVFNTIDEKSPTGITADGDFEVGPTAEAYDFTGSCFSG